MDPANIVQQFLESIREPTADPRRTVVLIAIGLVAFLVVAIIGFILLPPENRKQTSDWTLAEPNQAPRPRHSKLLLAISFALLLLVVVGLGYGDRRSREDAACLGCHVLEPVAASWEGGSHSQVACVECHDSPGIFGALETRVRALANTINNMSDNVGLHSPATVNQGSCRSCHENAFSGVLTVGHMRVRHSDFADVLSCGQCHVVVGHDGVDDQILIAPVSMTICGSCHDGDTASRDCATCHVSDIAYAGGGPSEYAQVRLGVPTTCRGCHSLEGCNQCHGVEMPHPPEWADPRSHAASGAFDTSLCVRCHDAGCTECHTQIHSSHPPDWRTKHQTEERRTCLQCHDSEKVGEDMCRLCHP